MKQAKEHHTTLAVISEAAMLSAVFLLISSHFFYGSSTSHSCFIRMRTFLRERRGGVIFPLCDSMAKLFCNFN